MTRTVIYSSPGGVSCRPVAGGATVAMRSFNVHLHQPWGVRDEMESGRRPVPWASTAERERALAFLATAPDVDRELRDRLYAHVRRTPVLEWGDGHAA